MEEKGNQEKEKDGGREGKNGRKEGGEERRMLHTRIPLHKADLGNSKPS